MKLFGYSNMYTSAGLVIFLAFICGRVTAYESVIPREQALAAMFPDAEIIVETVFLTESELDEARELSGTEIQSALIARYTILNKDLIIARGYVDTHNIRTKRESLLIVIDPDGRIMRIEITASQEPPEYRATTDWYRQYEGKILDNDLYIDRSIRPLAGATLTGQAANQAVRRVIAIDMVLKRKGNRP